MGEKIKYTHWRCVECGRTYPCAEEETSYKCLHCGGKTKREKI